MLFFRKSNPVVIRPRAEHTISRANIAPEALKVLYRLSDAGYKAYLVGGSVRDLLMGRHPKDFDISTDAQPREIKRLFRNCFLIGRRFRLAHVVFGDKVIETSTFRKQPDEAVAVADEQAPGALYQSSDNTFGTPEEDAKRRDFTVNGLFYDIKTFEIIDYVGGLRDLDQRILRSIGDPNVRFREDPVRMMRAVRLAARLGLAIERKTNRAIRTHHREIVQASTARVLEEIFRLFGFNASARTFKSLWETRLMAALMPRLDRYVNDSGKAASPLWSHLAAMDALAEQAGAEPSNGLRLAVLAYQLFRRAVETAARDGADVNQLQVAEQCLAEFNERFKVPKAIYYHALHLLDDQQRLDVMPAPGRRIRPGKVPEFIDALRLARIRLAVSGESRAALDAWSKLIPSASGHGHHETWVRSARSPRDAAPADAPAEEAAPAETDGIDADGASAPAEADPARRTRKRRHRGGRRHKRGPRGDVAAPGGDTPAAPAAGAAASPH